MINPLCHLRSQRFCIINRIDKSAFLSVCKTLFVFPVLIAGCTENLENGSGVSLREEGSRVTPPVLEATDREWSERSV